MSLTNKSDNSSFLRIDNLSVEYNVTGRQVKAVNGLSFHWPESTKTVGIVGQSGSGKTTLGMSLLNLIEPPGKIDKKSQIQFKGRDILKFNESELRNYRWKETSMIFQSAMNSLSPVKPAINHIVEVIMQHSDSSRSEAREMGLRLLSEVGIARDRVDDYPFELSGGMRQRVVIALALALSPQLLIADEPTSALDVVTQKQILSLIKREVEERKLSLVFITHEIALLCNLVETVLVMLNGQIVEMGPTEKVVLDPIHPYTKLLLTAVLNMDSNFEDISKAKYSKYVDQNNSGNGSQVLKEVESGRWVMSQEV